MSTKEQEPKPRSSRIQPGELAKAKIKSFLLRTQWFERLTHWTFQVCDSNKTGEINQDELYAGILLVHVNLAKYAGAAACYPPKRAVVNDLFTAVDTDATGQINEDEFAHILRICSVDIVSRIAVYYSILILLVPQLTIYVVDGFLNLDEFMGWHVTQTQLTIFDWVEKLLTWNQVAETVVSLAFFFLLIPLLFEYIDNHSTNRALRVKKSMSVVEDEDDQKEKKE